MEDRPMKLTLIPSPVRWIIVPTNVVGINLRLMREGRRVYAQIDTPTYAGEGTVEVATLPLGYRPNTIHRLLYGEASAHAPSKLVVVYSTTGLLQLRSKQANTGLFFNIEWTTDDARPPRFLERFYVWWGGRSETHTDHTQRHRTARTRPVEHGRGDYVRGNVRRVSAYQWNVRWYLDSQNPRESNPVNPGSRYNDEQFNDRSSVGLLSEDCPIPDRHVQDIVRVRSCKRWGRENIYECALRDFHPLSEQCDVRVHTDMGRFRSIPHDVPRSARLIVGGVL